MGQYKLSVSFRIMFGFCIEYSRGYSIYVSLPFILITIGLTDDANGFNILNIFAR